jgi:UDP-galactopyranose mutase
MKRFAQSYKVYFVEEPVHDAGEAFLEASTNDSGVTVLVPHLTASTTSAEQLLQQQTLLFNYFHANGPGEYIAWYYTPMALPLASVLPEPVLIVYDCMDELAAFKNAPPAIVENEKLLLKLADIVFTGGYSLYEAKKNLHTDVYAFPSSIDKSHFQRARLRQHEPADQLNIARPRIGFFGVLDERFDVELIDQIATARPDWQFILVGPVVKIDPALLPRASNIHYLGGKSYEELPLYLSGWDVAIIPFALNESTRFISPTKTPEYLAGGVPVVSTAIRDVVRPYGELSLAFIGNNTREFIEGIEAALHIRDRPAWLKRVDEFLAVKSWDATSQEMQALIKQKLIGKQSSNPTQKENEYV